jgi:phytoene dehydrogenase-like protein
MNADPFDVLVIGAGFGGLGAALTLAEGGAKVCVCEALKYPGGCASTFEREGFRFDAGATLVSGLGPGQLFATWLARYAPHTLVDWIDPLIDVRAPDLRLAVGRDRQSLIAQFCALPGAPVQGIRAFFERQRATAEVLWQLFDEPSLLPPFGIDNLARHLPRLERYAALAPLLGRSLQQVLAAHGLSRFTPLRLYVDALCQITVQCSAAQAEASFALAAMDYYYRGTAHVRGGVGSLASALLQATRTAGAEVRLPARVSKLRREPNGTWLATVRGGELRARSVVANLIPGALRALLGPDERVTGAGARLEASAKGLEDAWGAAMLYAVARAPEQSSGHAHHLQLISAAEQPLIEGNHVFVSVSSALEVERAPAGRRTLTISTHVPLTKLRAAGQDAGTYIDSVQRRMHETLALRAPEWSLGIERVLTASPRTFARFVGRPTGTVGGLPRGVGFANYRGLGPREVLDDLWMVGDSVFPGQSALATAIGGVRTATSLLRRLGASPATRSSTAPLG